jgi:hypothetical protein
LYLFANCTKPQPFPTGILTEAISPYWENVCLRSSSETLGSSPPTNIYNESLISYLKLVINDKSRKTNIRAEKLTVVFVESASDWLDVPFDWPPK